MLYLIPQHIIFVPNCSAPQKHPVSLIRGDVHEIPCCHDTFFSIVTYSVNITVRCLDVSSWR